MNIPLPYHLSLIAMCFIWIIGLSKCVNRKPFENLISWRIAKEKKS